MRQILVPVLLLSAVALSSSNVLPTAHRRGPLATYGQNDNTLRHRYTKPNNNIFYTLSGTPENNRLMSKLAIYLRGTDKTGEHFNDVVNEQDNYDVEGFRKEQWHNYPRQLDRLHEYLTHYHNGNMKRNSDLDDPGIDYDPTESKEILPGDSSTNEYLLDSNDNVYDTIVDATNPLLVLKVHLACLSNRLKNKRQNVELEEFRTQFNNEKETNGVEENLFTNEINPAAKVKREGITSQGTENSDVNTPGKKKSKRLFSLWSRLQSLSHKGHELPHRRHLAYYGFPEPGDGGAMLTAETRDNQRMMRPPGSPLRWG
ncbi:hypothetical protein NE865_05506 [Phthorimaea operculella]|nr:hypothetical protein NE865_05506 [Phthorimaea operculella]